MIVPFLDPPTPLCPSSHRGAITFVLRLFFFLCDYWMNRIRFMTSLHRLLNSMTTLLHSLSNIFIQYLLTIHNNDLVVACRRVRGVLSRVKCTLRALDRTPHPRLFIIIRAMARPAHSTHALSFALSETFLNACSKVNIRLDHSLSGEYFTVTYHFCFLEIFNNGRRIISFIVFVEHELE
mgnify:FL=1